VKISDQTKNYFKASVCFATGIITVPHIGLLCYGIAKVALPALAKTPVIGFPMAEKVLLLAGRVVAIGVMSYGVKCLIDKGIIFLAQAKSNHRNDSSTLNNRVNIISVDPSH
jgi:hypothetical protein